MTGNHARGMAGLAALRQLTSRPGAVRTCDERLLEKLLRRILNDLSDFSTALARKPDGTWYPGAVGYLPDLMAEDKEGRFLAGLEVKTRAHVNWGWYGTEDWHSQLDCYARRTKEIDAGDAPLYLVVDTTNKARIERELAAEGEWRIASASRWSVLTLTELLHLAPAQDDAGPALVGGPAAAAVDLLTSMMSEP